MQLRSQMVYNFKSETSILKDLKGETKCMMCRLHKTSYLVGTSGVERMR